METLYNRHDELIRYARGDETAKERHGVADNPNFRLTGITVESDDAVQKIHTVIPKHVDTALQRAIHAEQGTTGDLIKTKGATFNRWHRPTRRPRLQLVNKRDAIG